MERSLIDHVLDKARARPGILCLPETGDSRIWEGAALALTWGAFDRVVLFDRHKWHGTSATVKFGPAPDKGKIGFQNSTSEQLVDTTRDSILLHYRRRGREPSPDALERWARDPLYQSCQLVKDGEVDVAVAGAVTATSDVLRAALQVIGTQPGIKTLSGSFTMVRNGPQGQQIYMLADSGVCIDPTVDQLVEIASESVLTWKAIMDEKIEPVVAFLSFSTKGSAQHPAAEKMARAAATFRARHPDIVSDGELQFDAAFDQTVGNRKAPGSPVPGRANILIFPNLDAGNICYKVMQRLGGFDAFGPILQGLGKPVCDLSRGCSAQDVAIAATISLLRGYAQMAGV